MFTVGAPGVEVHAGRLRTVLVGLTLATAAVVVQLLTPLLVPGAAPSAGAQTTQVSTTVAASSSPSTATTTVGAPVTSAPKVAESVNDRSSTRKVQLIVGALTALGVLFGVLVAMYWRATKPLPAHLEGLDLLATRRYRKAPDGTREVLLASLDARRPDPSEAEIVADAQLLPDGHVGAAETIANVAPAALSGTPGAFDRAETELGRSNGAPFVVAPPPYPPEYPPSSMPLVAAHETGLDAEVE
jgi:hypothetical protein